MNLVRAFFPQIRALSFKFWKRAGGDLPDRQTWASWFQRCNLREYGATIYVKTILESWKFYTNFFIAKSRIAPLKEITIPRLELLGNLILVRLMNSVKTAIERDVQIDNIYYWTGSKVCLSWINSEKSFNVSVANRVQEIKRLSNKLSWCLSWKRKQSK